MQGSTHKTLNKNTVERYTLTKVCILEVAMKCL